MKILITQAATNDTYRTLDYGYTMAQFSLGFSGTVDGHTPYGIKPFLGTRAQRTLAQIPMVAVRRIEDGADFYTVSPNPVHTFMYIHLPEKAEPSGKMILTDLFGRKLKTWQWEQGKNRMQVDLFDVPSGVYLLHVVGGQSVKVIKE